MLCYAVEMNWLPCRVLEETSLVIVGVVSSRILIEVEIRQELVCHCHVIAFYISRVRKPNDSSGKNSQK